MKRVSEDMSALSNASSLQKYTGSIRSQPLSRHPSCRGLGQSVSVNQLPAYRRQSSQTKQSSRQKFVPVLSENARILTQIEEEKKGKINDSYQQLKQSQEFEFDLCSHIQEGRVQAQLNAFRYAEAAQDDYQIERNLILGSSEMNEVRDLFLKMRNQQNATICKQELFGNLGKFVSCDILDEIFKKIAKDPNVLTFAEFKLFYAEFMRCIGLDN